MKSQQLNFYLLPEDLNKIVDYLQNENWQLISQNNSAIEKQLNQGIYLIYKDLRVKNFEEIDIISMPVVEFWQPQIHEKELKRGRLYVITDFYENNELVKKDAAFIKATQNLFKWFKKNFQKVPFEPYKNFWTSPKALDWVEKGGYFSLNNA